MKTTPAKRPVAKIARAKPKSKRVPKFYQTQSDLIYALHALRLVVREVGNNYLANLQAKVARIEDATRNAREDEIPDRKQLVQMLAMLKWVHDINVKPQKGRRRDLKQLDTLIKRLEDLVEQW